MPKGLCFTAVVSSFCLLSFFHFTPNLGRQPTLDTKLFIYDCDLKNFSELLRAFTHNGLVAIFLGPTSNFDRTYLCKGT